MSASLARAAFSDAWPAVILRRVDRSCNMSRFWSASLQPSLFSEVLLVRNWGRIGSRGQERSYWFPDRQTALSALEKITAVKRRRGYVENDVPGGRPDGGARPTPPSISGCF